MKHIKKITRLLMAIALLCMTMGLTACGGQKTYKVTVKDALGNPYAGVIVKFMQNGEQVAMQACDEKGVAEKELKKGEYTIELMSTDDSLSIYFEEGITVTGKKNELEIIASNKVSSEPSKLSSNAKEYDAYAISDGCTYVELKKDDRNYFLYTPKTAGTYQFSIINNKDAKIGYYGSPHYVQSDSITKVKDNAFTISVSASMIGTGETGTNVFVLGVDSVDGKVDNCIIGIERIGEPEKTLADEPWTIYEATTELSAYVLPEGAVIKEFDLTASTDTYNVVYNEEDGFYHLNSASGPLVLVRLATDCDYIDCFQTILDRSGVNKYFYDKDDNFVKKEDYTQCLLKYIEYVDEKEGVYPLTEDLKYIIQQRGDYVGWWDIESSGYLFKDINGNNDASINSEIAWLLMCCYIE